MTDKPKTPKCDTCFVVKNKLRCCMCKYKTEEWLSEHISSVMFVDDCDCYKPKNKEDKQ